MTRFRLFTTMAALTLVCEGKAEVLFGGPVKLVKVKLEMDQKTGNCHDDVDNKNVRAKKKDSEAVVWRIHNLCGDQQVKITLTEATAEDKERAVVGCSVSPPKAGFTMGKFFPMKDKEVAYVFCSVNPYAKELPDKHRYCINVPGQICVASHELDIGVNP